MFPATNLSIVQAVGAPDEEVRRRAFGALVEVYWKPVYFHLRRRWQLEVDAAEDLTQEFFAAAMSRGFFDGFDPARARFRTFLKSCLDHFAANARRAELRLKRGGGQALLPLDFVGAEREFLRAGQVTDGDPDAGFHREWVRALFAVAVDSLRAEAERDGNTVRFQIFERYDLAAVDGGDRVSYRELATEYALPITQVTNHLAWARREFRRLILERLRELSASEAEYRSEARELLGVELE